jgi:peroxiredoxin
MIGRQVPNTEFIFREGGEFVKRTSKDLFDNKRVVIFSLPGAFTPTCSAYQLPGFEQCYDEISDYGIDDIFCLSVNDAFVMNAWADNQQIEKVMLVPDGNGSFTRLLGMEVTKLNVGFGSRSWRYAAVVQNGLIEAWFEEPGRQDEATEDPYGETSPEAVIAYLQSQIS